MTRIPRYRHPDVVKLRSLAEECIIVGGVPIPPRHLAFSRYLGQSSSLLDIEIRNEIGSQPQLMRALERSRFRDFLSQEVRLPDRVAVCLENFESGLRAAGLVAVDEILVQSLARPTKFRVQKRNVAMDGHGPASFGEGGAPGMGAGPAFNEVPSQTAGAVGSQSRPESVACLDGVTASGSEPDANFVHSSPPKAGT